MRTTDGKCVFVYLYRVSLPLFVEKSRMVLLKQEPPLEKHCSVVCVVRSVCENSKQDTPLKNHFLSFLIFSHLLDRRHNLESPLWLST